MKKKSKMLATSWHIVKIYDNITVTELFKNTRKENVCFLLYLFKQSSNSAICVSTEV